MKTIVLVGRAGLDIVLVEEYKKSEVGPGKTQFGGKILDIVHVPISPNFNIFTFNGKITYRSICSAGLFLVWVGVHKKAYAGFGKTHF